MIYFSSLLKTNPAYQPAADRLFAALDSNGVPYSFLENTHDIWARDFMPVLVHAARQQYVSFRYDPSYLDEDPGLKTDFRRDVSGQFPLEKIVYSDINLDGGNVVFSPQNKYAVISDRVFWENEAYTSAALVRELEELLSRRVIIIPSLPSDLTGHADGMVRFVDEHTAIGNYSRHPWGLERRIKLVLRNHGIEVIDFPYFESKGDSAVGCYLNFLETEQHVFLPVFGVDTDQEAITEAERIFKKAVVPVNINEIAVHGGGLNCISWECKGMLTAAAEFIVPLSVGYSGKVRPHILQQYMGLSDAHACRLLKALEEHGIVATFDGNLQRMIPVFKEALTSLQLGITKDTHN